MKSRYALIGRKLGHSYSPEIHNKIFEKLKLDEKYSLLEVEKEDLYQVAEKLRKENLLGINVTIPYKTDIIEFLDEISPNAKVIGAVNVVISKGGKLIGYNTDYDGFKITLDKIGIAVKNKKNFICGAGGAAKAIIKCLEDLGSENYLVTRDIEKAKASFSNFKNLEIISYKELDGIDNKNLIVNCTPCGMYPNVDSSVLEDRNKIEYKGAIDIVYNPKKTKFLEKFDMGENGLLMLVGQAIKAEEIWQNRKISNEILDEVYKEIYHVVYKK